jgi:hypothetical protein
MSKIPLREAVSALYDANGVARVVIGPTVYGTLWTLRRSLIRSTAAAQTTCVTYLNIEAVGAIIDNSVLGNNDTIDIRPVELVAGETLRFVWQAQPTDVGKSATAILQGTVSTGRLPVSSGRKSDRSFYTQWEM